MPTNKPGYDSEYRKSHYKRVPLDFKPDEYAEIKHYSEKHSESVTSYIRTSIRKRIDAENEKMADG